MAAHTQLKERIAREMISTGDLNSVEITNGIYRKEYPARTFDFAHQPFLALLSFGLLIHATLVGTVCESREGSALISRSRVDFFAWPTGESFGIVNVS